MNKPDQQEYAPFYAGYVGQVPDGDILEILAKQTAENVALYQSIPDQKWDYAYAVGKWTIKELLLHVLDAERVFAYRALRIARGDVTPMAGFDQDQYIPTSEASSRSAASIIEEYQALRKSTITMLKHFSPAMSGRIGTASGSPVSARALAYILTGHEIHHVNILKERYLA